MGVWIEIKYKIWKMKGVRVTPFVGVWIEISRLALSLLPRFRHSLRGSVDWNWPTSATNSFPFVTPFVGVWIEISDFFNVIWTPKKSLPSWECGLKYSNKVEIEAHTFGHSLRGSVDWNDQEKVAIAYYEATPFVGVWIEICKCIWRDRRLWSLPSWECGLKSVFGCSRC